MADGAAEGVGGGPEDEPAWLQEAAAVLARGASAVAASASQDAEAWLAARQGGRARTAAAGRRDRWRAAVCLQRAWRHWGGQCLIARAAARVAAAAVLTGRRLVAEARRQAHRLWRAAVREAVVRVQRCWRQWLQRRRVAHFWVAAATQAAAARRLQGWMRECLLASRVAGRQRQLEAARLGREILARLATAHEARLARAREGTGEVPDAPRLSSVERVEDARAWAAVELRRLVGRCRRKIWRTGCSGSGWHMRSAYGSGPNEGASRQ